MSSHSQRAASLGSSGAHEDHSLRGCHGTGCRGCVVEDFHGRPASCPLLPSVAPERPHPLSHGADSSRNLSFNFGEDARFSGSELYSCRAMAAPAATGKGGASADARAALAGGCTAGAECPSRGGSNAAMASFASELHVTHNGIVIPPIHGMPCPGGLPSEKLAEYAKVKDCQAPQRLRMPAKGAFSNVTSLAVLRRVQSLVNARQVEPAGWMPIDPSPMRVGAVSDGDTAEEESVAQMHRRAAAADGKEPEVGRAARDARVSAAHSPSLAPHGFSEALLMPSDAMTVAEKSEGDAAVVAATHAMQHAEDRGGAKEKGTRVQHFMPVQQHLRQQQQQYHHEGRTTLAHARAPTRSTLSPARPCTEGDTQDDSDDEQSPHRHRTAAPIASARYGDSMQDIAPCAVRTAALAQRSPTCTRASGRSQGPLSAYRPDRAPALTAAIATASADRKPSSRMPRGFEFFVEKGQQRRAEAERAQHARAAESAGELLTAASEQHHSNGDTAPSTGDRAATRLRMMSVMPLPRGYEMYARQGQSRRAKAEREEEERRTDDIVNCTHHPRVNRHGIVSASSARSARALQRSPHPQLLTSAAAEGDGAPTVETLPLSVFERLTRKAEGRDQRLLQLEECCAPSHQSRSFKSAAAAAAAAEGCSSGGGSMKGGSAAAHKHRATQQTGEGGAQRHKGRGAGRNVFEDLHAQERKAAQAATAASASPRSLASKVYGRGAASGRASAMAPNKTGTGSAAASEAAAEVTVHRRSQAEIEQHLAHMMSREAERCAKWEKHLVAQAAEEEQARHGHVVLNPKTDELAERARTRHRIREERAKQEREREEVQEVAAVAKKVPQRSASLRRAPRSPKPAEEGAQAAHKAVGGTEPTPTAATPVSCAAADDLYKHQLRAKERKQRHLEQVRLECAEEELSECTFRPRINQASGKMAQRLVVESFQDGYVDNVPDRFASATSPWEEVVGSDGCAGSVPQLAEYCDAHRDSLLVSSRSGSLFRELSQASVPAHYDVPSLSEMPRPRSAGRGFDSCAGMDYDDDHIHSNTERSTYGVPSVASLGREVTTLPPHSSGPLVEQLRSLEEMLHEWKEIERECSPIVKQPRKAGVVD
ncbi:conserved hypothetical protein [Leishmania major strain Friedlin]|uniref:Uncharacterized protein n=1 Tax=Leishmania major TaxID=5664 RepID=Q4QIW5_LEIMA|nr:conserved hypothetical protein [Leishmania major strain Friedlin]CAG9568909.1 hypothetical_protein_-_conserved [Leishmania major strain Friedlin]CAJ02158.1 conserved hypothetical protein [Leishmania major strain Friedlin]|eukprot:XP_001680883.1 conserved hypothetical protein [Leishmania major strain Friedlin]